MSAAAAAAAALPHGDQHIAMLGLGAIGISFLALHLTYTSATCSVYDPRPDLDAHMRSMLPLYLPPATATTTPPSVDDLLATGRLRVCTDPADAVRHATIIQESGPEKLPVKQALWTAVLPHALAHAHLWSSTSGIPASRQLAGMDDDSARTRLLVLHPFNPPHIMPLVEIVPSPSTAADEVAFARDYFAGIASPHRPVGVRREVAGFVANRLAFILLREAIGLVAAGVCSVRELDEIVRASLGVRWAVGGVFEMYNFGGGKRGMEGFLDIIGGAIRGVWEDQEVPTVQWEGGEGWREEISRQCQEEYGVPGDAEIRRRDRLLREVVKLQEEADRDLD